MFGTGIATKKEVESVLHGRSLEDKLLWLAQFGKPRLSMVGDRGEWHANCELGVRTPGSEFIVRSEFNHDTPHDALDVCIGRVQQALIARGN